MDKYFSLGTWKFQKALGILDQDFFCVTLFCRPWFLWGDWPGRHLGLNLELCNRKGSITANLSKWRLFLEKRKISSKITQYLMRLKSQAVFARLSSVVNNYFFILPGTRNDQHGRFSLILLSFHLWIGLDTIVPFNVSLSPGHYLY